MASLWPRRQQGGGRGMTEVALGSSSQDCHLETAEAWLEAGPGLSLQMGPLRLPLVPFCVPIRTLGTQASFKGCVVSKLSHQVSSPVSSPPVPSGQATSCRLPHCSPFVLLADGRSIPPKQMAMRWEIRHPRARRLPGLAHAQLLFLGLPCPPCKSCRVLGGAAPGPSNLGGRL